MSDEEDAIQRQKARAAADLATAQADSARAEADKARADARTAAAAAATAELNVGMAAPKIAAVTEPTDKSVKVDELGGAATAQLTAAIALERLAQRVAERVAAIISDRKRQLPEAAESYILEAYESDERIDQDRVKRLLDELWRGRDDWPDPDRTADTVWIVDAEVPAEAALAGRAIRARLTTFASDFDRLAPSGDQAADEEAQADAQRLESDPTGMTAAVAVEAATGLAKFGVELVGALRSRYALHSRTVNLSRTALITAVIGSLRAQRLNVRWSRFSPEGDAPLIDLFSRASAARDRVAATFELPKETKEDEDLKLARARALVSAFDTYVTLITSDPEGDANPALVEAALVEMSIGAAPDTEQDALLFLDISGQGADAVTAYGLLKGSKAAFIGYVQAHFILVRRSGKVLGAGTLNEHASANLDLDAAEFRLF